MGLVLNPAEIRSSAEQISASIEGTKESYNRAFRAVEKFSDNRELESESWNKIKDNAFAAHHAIVMGMAVAQDMMVQGLGTLVACVGAEYLDEDELITKIQSLTAECIMYEEMIKRLQLMQNNTIMRNNPMIARMIAYYGSLLTKTKMILELIKIKLESLRDKADMTSTLFQDMGPLLQAIESAINDAEYYISGTGTPSDGSWKMDIPMIINNIASNNLRDVLKNELDIDIESFKNLYGEEAVQQLQSYISENSIYSLNTENTQKILIKVLEQASGCTVTAVEEQYEFKDKNNVVKKFSIEKTKNIIKSGRNAAECLDTNGEYSNSLVEYVKGKEGCSLIPYNDGETIAYGFDINAHSNVTIQYNEDGSITQAEADRLLRIVLDESEKSLNLYLETEQLAVDQKTFDALMDLYYNRNENDLTKEIVKAMAMQDDKKLEETFLFSDNEEENKSKFDYQYAYNYVCEKDTKRTERYMRDNGEGLKKRRDEEFLIYKKGFEAMGGSQ